MQDGSNRYEDIFYCLAFRLGEQAFLSGGKNKKWEEGNNKMRGKRRRMLKKKKIPQKQQTNFDILKYRLGIDDWGIKHSA